ncbi:hypothetical protein QWZ13_06330 [Reinekea marina]|uniref:hypothetical protein n=1 Tax=Reinekea marina TaxID=1310421 RepID=UPI0025B28D09|nr:hypothetical protein [Reinekea marina]MDN3648525.1 hypothetical protein [Reinekea marina]
MRKCGITRKRQHQINLSKQLGLMGSENRRYSNRFRVKMAVNEAVNTSDAFLFCKPI